MSHPSVSTDLWLEVPDFWFPFNSRLPTSLWGVEEVISIAKVQMSNQIPMPKYQNYQITWRIIWLGSPAHRRLNSSANYCSLFVIWALTFIWTLSFSICHFSSYAVLINFEQLHAGFLRKLQFYCSWKGFALVLRYCRSLSGLFTDGWREGRMVPLQPSV